MNPMVRVCKFPANSIAACRVPENFILRFSFRLLVERVLESGDRGKRSSE